MNTVFHTSFLPPNLMRAEPHFPFLAMNDGADSETAQDKENLRSMHKGVSHHPNVYPTVNRTYNVIYRGISHRVFERGNTTPRLHEWALARVSLLNGNPTTVEFPRMLNAHSSVVHSIRLVSGIHTPHNGRVSVIGSLSMCSNKYIRYHDPDRRELKDIEGDPYRDPDSPGSTYSTNSHTIYHNLNYCLSLLDWTFQKSHLWHVSVFNHAPTNVRNMKGKTDVVDRMDIAPRRVYQENLFDIDVHTNSYHSNQYYVGESMTVEVCLDPDPFPMGTYAATDMYIELFCKVKNIVIKEKLHPSVMCNTNGSNSMEHGAKLDNDRNSNKILDTEFSSIGCLEGYDRQSRSCYRTNVLLPTIPGSYCLTYRYQTHDKLSNKLLNETMIVINPKLQQSYDRYIVTAFPYYISVLTSMVLFVIFIYNFIS